MTPRVGGDTLPGMELHRGLIEEIEAYCRRAGIAESTFGRQVVNDGKFVGRLREGKGVTTATVDRVRRFMTQRRRDGA